MKKTWFITGASRGFGRIWAKAALERGDKVTATNDACSFRNSGDQRDWNRKRSEIGWGDRTGKCEWSCPLSSQPSRQPMCTPRYRNSPIRYGVKEVAQTAPQRLTGWPLSGSYGKPGFAATLPVCVQKVQALVSDSGENLDVSAVDRATALHHI
jgi:NAD(P)-dependent dehydrogenase (short-subunit alcohol dehydrogenase family)